MVSQALQPGQWVSIRKPDLQGLIERLLYLGYRVVGPQVRDGAVVFDDLDDVRQLPIGVLDVQDGGTYRLREDPQAGYFDFVVGPHSLKNFLFPPRNDSGAHAKLWILAGPASGHCRAPSGCPRRGARATCTHSTSKIACFYEAPMSIRRIAPAENNCFWLP